MREGRVIVAAVVSLALATALRGEVVSLPGTISLPARWVLKTRDNKDSRGGTITRDKQVITYDIGPGAGLHVSPKGEYAWYTEQEIRGHRVLMALVKMGGKEELRVCYPDGYANFWAEVKSPEEMLDVMAIALSFDYSVPKQADGRPGIVVTDP